MSTVLLVEDDPQFRAIISKMLQEHGINADVATDAAAAAALLDRHQYCAILLDLVLGEGSGFDVLAHLRSRNLDVPTIVISGKLADYTREVLALYDAVHVVYAKPANPETLARIVLAFCDRSA
jgi:DNA-binding response OmpR family regulator